MLNNQEQNLKDFNSVYCVFVKDDSLVTSSQIDYLHNLAYMCPFTEGLAVYEARGLMRTWNDSTFYFNVCEYNIPEELYNNSRFSGSLTKSQSSVLSISVYPNPSNGSLNVNVNAKDCIFEVYDVIGKRILSQKLSDYETTLDISSFNNGTYLFKVLRDNILVKTDKLIINK